MTILAQVRFEYHDANMHACFIKQFYHKLVSLMSMMSSVIKTLVVMPTSFTSVWMGYLAYAEPPMSFGVISVGRVLNSYTWQMVLLQPIWTNQHVSVLKLKSMCDRVWINPYQSNALCKLDPMGMQLLSSLCKISLTLACWGNFSHQNTFFQ